MTASEKSNAHQRSIATHDPALLDPISLEYPHRLIQEQRIKLDLIEFEMLKGMAQERLEALKSQGYRTRVYLPYGQEWHLYLCNRLAEYPPNIYQAITDAFKNKYSR